MNLSVLEEVELYVLSVICFKLKWIGVLKIRLFKKGITSCVIERADLCCGDNKNGDGSIIFLYYIVYQLGKNLCHNGNRYCVIKYFVSK